MDKHEIMQTRYGEMLDMISCLSIYEGKAQPAKEKITDFEKFMELL